MSVLSYVHQLFNVDQCQASIHTLRWKDRPLQCPRCQSRDVEMTSPILCSTRVGGPCRTGFWQRFSSVSRVRLGVLPESWASIAGPVIAGAGGCGIRRCPMRRIVSETARLRRMISTTSLGTKVKRSRAGPDR